MCTRTRITNSNGNILFSRVHTVKYFGLTSPPPLMIPNLTCTGIKKAYFGSGQKLNVFFFLSQKSQESSAALKMKAVCSFVTADFCFCVVLEWKYVKKHMVYLC